MSYTEFTYYGKSVEEMTTDELMAERDLQSWAKNRANYAAIRMQEKIDWLRENEPVVSEDEIRKMYENGELSEEEMKSLRKVARKRLYEYNKAVRQLEFCRMAEKHYKAMQTRCSEQIQVLRANKPIPIRGRSPAQNRPRKFRSPWRRPVADGHKLHAREIVSYRYKWNLINQNFKDFEKQLQKIVPISNWDYERLLHVANSRGYISRPALEAAVAQALGITVGGASNMLKSGKMTWQHITTIGSLLEMTPAEFCDVFLYDYFKESVDGKWVAD